MKHPGEIHMGRRVFIGLLGAGAAGIVFGAQVQDWLERVVGPVISKDGTGLSSLLPIGRFRIYTVTGNLPGRSREEYRLKVEGLVDEPLDLEYADLQAMTPTTLHRDFQCVTGWRVPDVEWRGVLLRDVLDRAGVQPKAKALRFMSFDGTYTESLTLDQARRSDVLVAYELEGKQLSRSTVGRCGCTSRRCTATSRASGWSRSASSTRCAPATGSTAATTSTGGSARATAATTSRRERHDHGERRPSARRVARFDRTERVVHWCNATLFLMLIATGAALYAGPVSPARRPAGTGAHDPRVRRPPAAGADPRRHRAAVRTAAARRPRPAQPLGPRRPHLVAEGEARERAAREVQSRSEVERDVPRRRDRRHARHRFDHALVRAVPDRWRTGATFVHDWFALGVGLAVFGHILLAVSDPDALRGMVHGWVPARWAKEKRPRWYDEVSRESTEAADSGGAVGDVVAGAE